MPNTKRARWFVVVGNTCHVISDREDAWSSIRWMIPRRGRAFTNDWRISMARAIIGNSANSGSDQRRPTYDQLLRPTTNRTITRGDRSYDQSWRPATNGTIYRCILRPIVRAIVASCVWPIVRALVASCDRVYDQSWHPTADCTINCGVQRSIVASCDRSYDLLLRPSADRPINRGTKQPIVWSIVASQDRSYDQSCDYRSATIHNWWCHHARLVVRSPTTSATSCTFFLRLAHDSNIVWLQVGGNLVVSPVWLGLIGFKHDHRPCCDWFCHIDHPRPPRPVVRPFYDLPTIPTKITASRTDPMFDCFVSLNRSQGMKTVQMGLTIMYYFVNVGPSLAENIHATDTHFSQYLSASLYLNPVTQAGILQLVANIKPKKSKGHDELYMCLIKMLIPYIVVPLKHIFNLSILNGVFPDSMKIARVIPLFKTGNTKEFSNYRPISLLPQFSKILDNNYHSRLMTFIDSNQILYKSQYGFRKQMSTSLAILELVEEISNSLDNHESTVFIDLKKAFDTVDHGILTKKLYHYGIRGIANKWICSYLMNIYQYVNINGTDSDYMNVLCGVPQGSILGPIIFILYINDMCNVSTLLKPILFADDTNLFYSGKDIKELCSVVSIELDKLCKMVSSEQTFLKYIKNEFHGVHKQKLRWYIFCMHEWTKFIESIRHQMIGCAYGL